MNVAYIVLLILLIIYIPLYIYVRRSPKMAERGILPYGPAIMIKTRWGLKTMDRLGKHRKLWNVVGIIGVAISFVLMAMIVGILIIDLMMLPAVIGRGGIGIEYALAIPGLNPMLPLVYGIIGLVIAMVLHELSHGIQSRANDIDVESSGLLYGVVPLGAFVEPNNEQVEKATRKARMHLFSAGIATNFIIAIVLFVLMSASVGAGLTTEYGDTPAVYSVVSDSPADDYGVPGGSLIVGIDGSPVSDVDDLESLIPSFDAGCSVTYLTESGERIIAMPMGVYITGVLSGTPAYDKIPAKCFITSINGTEIGTVTEFSKVITALDPGDEVPIGFIRYDGTLGVAETVNVTLGESSGKTYLGVYLTDSGIQTTTPNIVLATGTDPFYGCDTLSEYAMSSMSFISMPFEGFSPVPEDVQWWYDSTVLPDDVFWVLMSIIYWTFWLNLVLGISNALPAMPFDGGYVFNGGLDFLLEKFGVSPERREFHVNSISSIVTWVTLMIMMLVIMVIII